ncbi:MAG: CPBP family intramembrane metalloprotease [Candidatus Obscuribacterales bacterium]|nr:CPBP family intramembrane metalloprotease [Candidatus Obscuribacterales bacterium]
MPEPPDNENEPENQNEPDNNEDDLIEIPSSFNADTVFIMTVLVETGLLLLSTLWLNLASFDSKALYLDNPFSAEVLRQTLSYGLCAGLAVSCLNIILMIFSLNPKNNIYLFRSFRDLIFREMMPLFGGMTLFKVCFLAFISGVSEEIFFRGVLEAKVGSLNANLCFALAHFPRLYYFPYAAWAGLVGMLMSYLKVKTGNLLTPMICHMVINLISIWLLTKLANKRKEEA